MIYFDNAATGGFKPSIVTETAINTIKYLNANAGRSGHRLSIKGAKTVLDTRLSLASFFGATDFSRVIFTKNATEALNTLLFGTKKIGGHIITTVYEHNSVLRPIEHLKREYGITCTVVDSVYDIEKHVNDKTYLVIVNHVSNVTGHENDLEYVGNLLKDKDIIFASDVSQSAGHVAINMQKLHLNAICCAGHKAMCSIMGSGFLIFDENTTVNPLTFGGTGTDSLNVNQPTEYPERLESGTLNLPAIASLGEATEYVKNNLTLFSETLFTLTDFLCKELEKIDGVKLYSTPNRYGIVSFSLSPYTSGEVADILSREYDIAVRGGLHCAPLIHKKLSTQLDGLVRVSLAPQNTLREVQIFLRAVYKISKGITIKA